MFHVEQGYSIAKLNRAKFSGEKLNGLQRRYSSLFSEYAGSVMLALMAFGYRMRRVERMSGIVYPVSSTPVSSQIMISWFSGSGYDRR